MDDKLILVFVGSFVVMVIAASVTKSLGGAFLGLAVVCFAGAVMMLQQGGLAILGGIGFGVFGMICMLLGFALGANYAHSNMTRCDPSGNRWEANQTLWGDGAKNSSSHWTPPNRQVDGGDHSRLGSGE